MLKSDLIKGTIILTISGIFIRCLGLLSRMIFSRLIGAEGLGLFQAIIPVYTMLIVLMGLGLPGAVAKMVAEKHARGNISDREFLKNSALKFVFFAAVIGTTIYYFIIIQFGENIFPDHRILTALKIIPFGVYFATLSIILRSYFQGKKNLLPIAISQSGEQTLRIILGLLAAYILIPYGLQYTLAGIAFGVVGGEIFGFCLLVIFNRKDGKKYIKNKFSYPKLSSLFKNQMVKEMFALALPLVFIRMSGSITHVLESLLIPLRLQEAGFNAAQSMALFGELSGMALPLLYLPTVLIIPLNTALVPYVAQTSVLNQKEKLSQVAKMALWGTLLLGILVSLLFRYFSTFFVSVLYGNPSAAPLVSMLACSAPMAYLQFTTASILHGLGKPGIAVLHDLIGTIIALILIYYLTALPWIGINGAIWAYSVSFSITSLLGCLHIHSTIKRY